LIIEDFSKVRANSCLCLEVCARKLTILSTVSIAADANGLAAVIDESAVTYFGLGIDVLKTTIPISRARYAKFICRTGLAGEDADSVVIANFEIVGTSFIDETWILLVGYN
jgi:hypothetical protein